MCGIVGIIRFSGITDEDISKFRQMLVRCESRGRDASGFFDQKLRCVKVPLRASEFVNETAEFTNVTENIFERAVKGSLGCKYIIGHCRQATRGRPDVLENNHPVFTKDQKIYLVHNGCVSCAKYDKDKEATDTYIFINAIEEFRKEGKSLSEIVEESFKQIEKDSTFNDSVIVVGDQKEVVFCKNDGRPLLWQLIDDSIVFGSETTIINSKEDKSKGKNYFYLHENEIVSIKLDEIKMERKLMKGKREKFEEEQIEYNDDWSITQWTGYRSSFYHWKSDDYWGSLYPGYNRYDSETNYESGCSTVLLKDRERKISWNEDEFEREDIEKIEQDENTCIYCDYCIDYFLDDYGEYVKHGGFVVKCDVLGKIVPIMRKDECPVLDGTEERKPRSCTNCWYCDGESVNKKNKTIVRCSYYETSFDAASAGKCKHFSNYW